MLHTVTVRTVIIQGVAVLTEWLHVLLCVKVAESMLGTLVMPLGPGLMIAIAMCDAPTREVTMAEHKYLPRLMDYTQQCQCPRARKSRHVDWLVEDMTDIE